MKEYKKFGISLLDSHDWIFLAHHCFKVVDLSNDEVIYEEKEPFNYKYRQIANITLSEDSGYLLLITFKSDYAIYHIDYANKKVSKEYLHIQKGDYFRSDVSEIWNKKDSISLLIEKNNKSILRHIKYTGELLDISLGDFYSSKSFCTRSNLLLNTKECIYIFNNDHIEKYNLPNKNIECIFKDDSFDDTYVVIKENDIYKIYKEEKLILEYTPNFKDSNIDIRTINKEIIIAEVENEPRYPIFVYRVAITCNGETKIMDLNKLLGSNNDLYHVTSFNKNYVSFYRERKSILVINI